MHMMAGLNIKKTLFLCSVLLITLHIQVPQQGSLSPLYAVAACAEEADFETKMSQLEDRTKMLHMVIKKLMRTFKKAKKNHDFLVANGMPQEDVDRLEAAFKKKMQKMIDETIVDIGKI